MSLLRAREIQDKASVPIDRYSKTVGRQLIFPVLSKINFHPCFACPGQKRGKTKGRDRLAVENSGDSRTAEGVIAIGFVIIRTERQSGCVNLFYRKGGPWLDERIPVFTLVRR